MSTSTYHDQMHAQWQQDPSSVDVAWSSYFSGGSASADTGDLNSIIEQLKEQGITGSSAGGGNLSQAQSDGFKIMQYIRAFMTHGHFAADLDPLKLQEQYGEQGVAQKFSTQVEGIKTLLDIETYGFTQVSLDKTYQIDLPYWGGILARKQEYTLRELRDLLTNAYCGKIGVEYMHIPSREQCNWIRNKVENRQFETLSKEDKHKLLDRILWADGFNEFIGTKYNTLKRFGLEGCDSFIPGMKSAIDALHELGGEKAVVGMPHRGRLSFLANVVRKPLSTIFAEFQGNVPEGNDQESHSGDVKYHLGTNYTKTFPDGRGFNIEILANPSHLECINPVVMGRVRAENHIKNTYGDTQDRDKVVPFLVHGDASFAGQGVVYESIQMQDLKNYTVGGTIHVIVNNQIGFTTVPSKGRSGNYSSDLAKAVNAPIFHVNAQSIEDVHHTFKMAAEYRQKFNHDVIIDLIGYRKFGHNELDQPSFTQPMMYKQVAKMTPVAQEYEQQLLDEGTFKKEEIDEMKKFISDRLEAEYIKSKDVQFESEKWLSTEWERIHNVDQDESKISGVDIDRLQDVGSKIAHLPSEHKFHRLIRKIFEAREQSISKGVGIDWGTAEALAFATLIQDGFQVRISGQDVERGTFSHRHAHVFFQDKDGYYNPINEAVVGDSGSRKFIASNSHLSEFAVMGYELGYAQTCPNTLTMWEAQFGDFANGAQVIIDQFFSSGQAKWNVENGLVVLLPHGYDGNGPEHSSCRTERWLLLCDQDSEVPHNNYYSNTEVTSHLNMQVVHPSTAANYFHLLRQQTRRNFRKPLVVVAPKKLLRFKGASSKIEDFTTGTKFLPVIGDKNENAVAKDKIRKIVLCSGQVYFDLEERRAKENHDDVAIVRVESICPFPFKEIAAELEAYPNAEVVWSQEESKNAGSYTYVVPRLRNIQKFLNRPTSKVGYAGRPILGATSVGYSQAHKDGLENLINDAFN